MSEFKPIETQEALDAIIKDRLERQKKSVTDEIKKQFEGWVSPEDAKKTSEQIDSLNTKLADSEKKVAELTSKNSAYEISSVKMRIAHETGIPYELAERLSGSNEEEIRKDAEILAQYAAQPTQATPSFSGESPVGNTADAAFKALAHDLLNN